VQASPKKKTLTKGGEHDFHTLGYTQLHTGGTVTTSLCPCVCFLWITILYYIAQIFEHRKQYNSTAIIAGGNQGNASAQSQLVNAFISVCGNNDTHIRDYANPVELLWDFTACQGAPRHLLQLAEKISSVLLWATLHRVGFTGQHYIEWDSPTALHVTRMNVMRKADNEHSPAMIEVMN
jgi:hypothetical protein